MSPKYSILILAVGSLLLGSCASVQSTSAYYLPYTTKVYPPKSKDFNVPILGKAPSEPHKTIGRLAFQSDQGWNFMRKSMVYNAQINGADAVILKNADARNVMRYTQVPPQVDWVPVGGGYYSGGNGNCSGYSRPYFVPIFQPGYVQQWQDTIVGIDAEMIVFK